MYNLLHDKELDDNIENIEGILDTKTVQNYLLDVFYFFLKDSFSLSEICSISCDIIKDILTFQKECDSVKDKIDLKLILDYFDKVSFL